MTDKERAEAQSIIHDLIAAHESGTLQDWMKAYSRGMSFLAGMRPPTAPTPAPRCTRCKIPGGGHYSECGADCTCGAFDPQRPDRVTECYTNDCPRGEV